MKSLLTKPSVIVAFPDPGDAKVNSKLFPIGPKYWKFGHFSDQFSVSFGSADRRGVGLDSHQNASKTPVETSQILLYFVQI